MKRKFLIILLSVVSVVCLALGLSACNSGNSDENHIHTYGTDNICTECGYKLKYTEGLTYYGLTSGSSVYAYMYCGGDKNAAGEVTIAAYYNGLPVTTVLLGSTDRIEAWYMAQMASGTITGDDFGELLEEFYEEYYGQEITSINIPDGITDVSLDGYSSLKNASLSETVSYLSVYSCDNLTDINIPANLISVSISYCPALETETENGITYYKNCVIDCAEEITKADLREGTTAICSGAFSYNTALTEIVIPSSMKYICDGSFSYCSSLTSVTLNEGVKYIGHSAFIRCSSLTKITIPSSVTNMGIMAFAGCYKLVEVTNLSSLDITAGSSENGDVGFYAVNVYNSTEADSRISEQDGYLFVYDEEGNYYLFGYTGTDTDLILPELVIDSKNVNYTIYDNAFYNNDIITSVIIDSSVTSIGNYAFYDCTALTSLTIGKSVTSIGNYAFFWCKALTNVTIPDGVTSIGVSAFDGCTALTNIYYGGTANEWNSISIDINNNYLTEATLYYYSASEPDYTDGYNYWHYVDGEIVVWTEE